LASPAVVARSSDALRESRCVGADVHTPERGAYARRGKPCRRGAVFGCATRVKVWSLLTCTQLRVEHTLAGASPAVVATAPAKARRGTRGKNPSPEELELQGLATAETASTRIKSPAARSLTFHTNEREGRRGAMERYLNIRPTVCPPPEDRKIVLLRLFEDSWQVPEAPVRSTV
jgi:hypothetical protein